MFKNKSFIFLLIFILSFSLIGCSKDVETITLPNEPQIEHIKKDLNIIKEETISRNFKIEQGTLEDFDIEEVGTIEENIQSASAILEENIPQRLEEADDELIYDENTFFIVDKELKVHFLDVGQADSILITLGDKTALIDAGEDHNSKQIISYLKSLDINTIDFLIGTHPHADHIGGMASIVKEFNIGQIYMPKVLHTTKTFENLLNTIKTKGMKITTPSVGKEFYLENAKFTFLAPQNKEYKDLNNYSIGLKLEYGDTSVIFTGDAEINSEKEMINSGVDLSADILKVGHHGSSTSTSKEFLNKVNPKYAIISVGNNNRYNHPHQEVIQRLIDNNIKIYRTDTNGTIVMTTNGSDIEFTTLKSSVNNNIGKKIEPNMDLNKNNNTSKTEKQEEIKAVENVVKDNDNKGKIVYITKTGSKYHGDGCRHLSKSKIEIKLEEALKKDYTPCSVCFQ